MYSDNIDDLLQMERLPWPTTKLEALRNLEMRLRRLREIHDEDRDGARLLSNDDYLKSFAPKVSLLIVTQFIEEVPGWDRLDFGLLKMVGALSEIENGRVPDWLGIPPAIGHPGTSDRVLVLRASFAGVMEFLMRNDFKRKPAAQFVWDRLPSAVAGQVAGPRGTWRSVAGWRDDVSGLPLEGFETQRDAFQQVLNRFDLTHGEPHERASRMLGILATIPL
jgi:hypothetical protein